MTRSLGWLRWPCLLQSSAGAYLPTKVRGDISSELTATELFAQIGLGESATAVFLRSTFNLVEDANALYLAEILQIGSVALVVLAALRPGALHLSNDAFHLLCMF